MDRFLEMEVFVNVAETGGFAAAARKLSMSPPAVTRAVASLEDRIGSRLFIRTTRSVRLTDSGQRFLRDCQRILSDVEEAQEAAIGSHSAPRGRLNVTAPALFGRMYVTPVLIDFLRDFPLVNLNTLFLDRVVNMIDEGMDIAVRIGDLPDSSLNAVRVGYVRKITFASQTYLKKHGIPQHPSELEHHQTLQSNAVGSSNIWSFEENGTRIHAKANPRFETNTNDTIIEAVLKDFGISRLLSYQIAPYLGDGRLKIILSEFEEKPLPVHILHQEGRMVSAKVRACVDYLVERLRADPHLN